MLLLIFYESDGPLTEGLIRRFYDTEFSDEQGVSYVAMKFIKYNNKSTL